MIGSLGRIVFETSSELLRTFSGLSKSSEARFAQHDVLGKKPRLEFIGAGIEDIGFNMRLDVSHGVNPLRELERLEIIRDTGSAEPLMIGGKYYGDFVIISLNESRRNLDNRGRLLLAEVSVQIREYVE